MLLHLPFPVCFRRFKGKLQFFFLVSKTRRKLIVLGFNSIYFIFPASLYLSLQTFDFFGDNNIRNMHSRPSFVQCINGFVREITVTYVTVCQFDTRLQCIIGIGDIMVILVPTFYIIEDLQSLLGSCRLDHNLLETAFQSTIFFYIFPIFIECCSTDTLNLSPRKSRF